MLTLPAFAAAFLLASQAPATPAAAIVGTWHGTSTCVDRARDTACADEEVIYDVDAAPAGDGLVRIHADKLVGGTRQDMGEFVLRYDSTTHAWTADIKMRMSARWSFEPKGDAMTGTLAELPSGRIIRRIAARRTS